MDKIKDGGSAFPRTGSFTENQLGAYDSTSLDGMSLRDWFVGQAIVGLLASGQWNNATVQDGFAEHVASQAGEIADAAIAERERQP